MSQDSMNMGIRKSTMEDITKILALYEDARVFMKEQGNHNQWGDGYPPKSLVEQDILSGKSYVCLKDGQIVGTFFYSTEKDPTYEKITGGNWQNHEAYGVVHRITSDRSVRGVGSFCLNWCLNQLGNLRIDTHRDNRPMQKVLKHNGFTYCGVIYLADGSERIAFQKVL